MTDLVCGKFQLTESKNFEEFMQALGVGYLTRKLGNKSFPVVTVSKDGDLFHFKNESLVKTTESSFKLNEQFDELTADGRQVKSTMTLLKPNTLKHDMIGTQGGKDSSCVREFFKDKMTCVCQVDDVVTERIYTRKE
ncbi:myelin P2 protein [Eurytemora carolleeae]|uniref:myelin P2 protein n=1 Tax=Eurytemora carolleeae TaxID=1294199 RepID=UPI000C78699E|nr:myelin P2 protein [Eurytemora carolleeae]|eukprot:XP_023339872.1 myelin P2 protein-like [Eurytemora affinis]